MKKLLDRMVDLVRRGEIGLFSRRAHEFEPADLAEVLTALDQRERVSVVQALPPEVSSQTTRQIFWAISTGGGRSRSWPRWRTAPR